LTDTQDPFNHDFHITDHEDQASLLAQLREAVKNVNAFENNARRETAALDAIERNLNQNEAAVPSEDLSVV